MTPPLFPPEVTQAVTSIFAVVVLYKMLPAQSPSLATLLEASVAVPSGALRLRILIVDNTPGGQSPGPLPEGVLYRAAPHNPGLAEAYNGAIEDASAANFPWLLTLDQDTTLPPDFLSLLVHHVRLIDHDKRVAVLAGHIVDRGRSLAPYHLAGGFWPIILPRTFAGLAKPFTSTLNSAVLLRIAALQAIGGYDERFPLNNSDTSLFHRLGLAGQRMYIVGGLTISHELAMMDREQRMSPDRYRQVLADERAFWDRYMNLFARVERLLKLFGRLIKGMLRGERKEFSRLTFQELRLRLLSRRKQRIQQWERRFQRL